MKKVTVYCASSLGTESRFKEEAIKLGEALAKRNIGLVYGGAKVGLMGAVADGALSRGGKVTGVLPHFLAEKELAHDNLTELILVENMHIRKAKMAELCDGIITLPGGFGTMEELFEMLTWAQLGLHKKPIAILNTGGYYDALIEFIETMIKNGLLKEEYRNLLLIETNIEELLNRMEKYQAPANDKWFVTA